MTTGRSQTFDCDGVVGEVGLALRLEATDELAGSRSPPAKVAVPQRVPHRLHGDWFSAE